MPARHVLALSAGVLGLVVGAAGVVVLSTRAAAEPAIGWFAYSPLAEQPLAGLVVVDEVRASGVALVTTGLALVALALGLVAGGRHARGRRNVAVLAVLVVLAGLVALAAAPRTTVQVGGGPPRPMDPDAATWTFPTLLWAPAQVAGAAAALLGVVVLVGLLGAWLGSRTQR